MTDNRRNALARLEDDICAEGWLVENQYKVVTNMTLKRWSMICVHIYICMYFLEILDNEIAS